MVPFILEHDYDYIAVHIIYSVIERRLIICVLDCHVSFVFQQQLHCLHVATEARVVQSCILHIAEM